MGVVLDLIKLAPRSSIVNINELDKRLVEFSGLRKVEDELEWL